MTIYKLHATVHAPVDNVEKDMYVWSAATKQKHSNALHKYNASMLVSISRYAFAYRLQITFQLQRFLKEKVSGEQLQLQTCKAVLFSVASSAPAFRGCDIA